MAEAFLSAFPSSFTEANSATVLLLSHTSGVSSPLSEDSSFFSSSSAATSHASARTPRNHVVSEKLTGSELSVHQSLLRGYYTKGCSALRRVGLIVLHLLPIQSWMPLEQAPEPSSN